MGSRGALRAQLSLTFDDEQLYDALIIPYKEDKELNSLVVKLLTKYFYNEDVRALVDGSSEQDMQMESESDSRINDMFRNAQQLMACMSVLEDVAIDDLQNSISTVSDLMNTTAKATGGTEETNSQFGLIPAQANFDFQRNDKPEKVEPKQAKASNEGTDLGRLELMMEKVITVVSSLQGSMDSMLTLSGLSPAKSKTVEEFMSEDYDSEVQLSENYEEPVSDSDVDDIEQSIEDPVVIDNPVTTSETVEQPLVVEETVPDEHIKTDSQTEQSIDGKSVLAEFASNLNIFG